MKNDELLVQHGDDPSVMTKRLLQRSNMQASINPTMRVGIKPNLVVAQPAANGATTHVEIVRALVESLRAWGIGNIVIMEGAWVGDSTQKAFDVCGYRKMAEDLQVSLIDLKTDEDVSVKSHGLDLAICRTAMEVDVLINVPVLKGHCQTRMTCALKNMKGCISDREKRRYHTIGLHDPIAALNTVLKQDWILVDAMNGDLTYEGGGSPVPLNRMILARDPVLVDAWGARLMGYTLEDVPYLKRAAEWGVGSANLDQAKITEEGKARRILDPSSLKGDAGRYRSLIRDQSACSACYAALVHALRQLDNQDQVDTITDTLAIGQGYRNARSHHYLGIGDCASGMSQSVEGCPPDPASIRDFLTGRRKK